MSSVKVYDTSGKEKGTARVPEMLSEKVRPDLIVKAFLAERANRRQPYGSDALAGQRSSAHYHGRRQTRNSMMNRELARMKRIHNQGFLGLTARIVPQAVKGRRAHPPKTSKVWKQKINKKERMKALCSALSASLDRETVEKRGHKVGRHFPLVFEDGFQRMEKTKQVVRLLEKAGLREELERCSLKKVRSGKGTMRGRRYRRKKGPLVIISEDNGIGKALGNIPGVDFSTPKNLTVELAAPGTHPGRLVIWTKSALEKFGEKDGRKK